MNCAGLVRLFIAVCAMLLVGEVTPGIAADLPTRGEGVSDDVVQTFRDRNGAIFEGWPKPRAVVIVTGDRKSVV